CAAATRELHPLPLHDALPISAPATGEAEAVDATTATTTTTTTTGPEAPATAEEGPGAASATPGANSPVTPPAPVELAPATAIEEDRKSTRLNSSHVKISYAVF